MKKFIALLTFFICSASFALANNGDKGKNGPGDPEKKDPKKTYEVSVTKSYFSFFSLFSIEPTPVDSLLTNKNDRSYPSK